MNRKPLVIGIGELLWDMLPEGKKAGGAPVNFVYNAALCGCEAVAITAVGNDELGDELLQEAENSGINVLANRTEQPTGTVDVVLNDGIPSYTINENVAWDHIEAGEDAVALVSRASAVCFGTLAMRSEDSRLAIKQLVSAAPAYSYKVLDLNLRQSYWSKSIIAEALDLADVLKLNDEELAVVKNLFGLDGLSDEEACRDLMKGYKLRMLILTAGADYSSIYYDDGDVSTIETPKVEVVDTVGAGDAFLGAFMAAFLNDTPVKIAHKVAAGHAAYVCQHAGAWE